VLLNMPVHLCWVLVRRTVRLGILRNRSLVAHYLRPRWRRGRGCTVRKPQPRGLD